MLKFKPEQIIYKASLSNGIAKHTIVSVNTKETGYSTSCDYRLKGFAGTAYSGEDFYETFEAAKSALLLQTEEIHTNEIDKINKMEVVEYP